MGSSCRNYVVFLLLFLPIACRNVAIFRTCLPNEQRNYIQHCHNVTYIDGIKHSSKGRFSAVCLHASSPMPKEVRWSVMFRIHVEYGRCRIFFITYAVARMKLGWHQLSCSFTDDRIWQWTKVDVVQSLDVRHHSNSSPYQSRTSYVQYRISGTPEETRYRRLKAEPYKNNK